jgi:hypothetical protein
MGIVGLTVFFEFSDRNDSFRLQIPFMEMEAGSPRYRSEMNKEATDECEASLLPIVTDP